MSNYLSNRVKSLKIGIKGYTESTDVLDVLGDANFEGAINLNTSSNSIEIKAPPSLGTNLSFTLPTSDGDPDQVLATDGNGVLSWVTRISGSGTTGDFLSSSTASTQSGYFGDIFLFDDSTPSHYLQVTNSANLTAPRSLSINVNDANRTISLSGNLTVSDAATVSGTNTGDQTITLTGDVTGSGTGSFTTTLANSGVTAGTYTSVTVDAKGRVTAGTNPVVGGSLSDSTTSTQSGYFGNIYLYDDSTPSHYLEITNSANLTAQRTLSVNVNDASRTISLSGDLTVSSAATISGTNTGDQTITLTGDVTGTGTGSFATTLANSGVAAGTYNDSATTVRPFTVDVKGRITSIGTAVTITPAFSSLTSVPTTLSGYGITDALSSSTTSTQSGYFGNIYLYDDSTPSHYLEITNSANLTAARTLSINVNDASRTISLSGNLTLANNLTTSGNFAVTLTATNTTTLTLPTTGTLLTTAGSGSSLTFGTGSLSLAGNLTTSGAFATTITVTGTTTVTLPTSGTLATTGNLSQFASTTSAQLAGVLSDETGFSTGALAVFNISPSFSTSISLSAQAELRFADADSTNYVAFKSPATVTANRIYTLPSTIGSAGDVLKIAAGATATDATLEWGAGGASITIANDTSTSSPQYLTFSSVTSGTLSSLNVSSTNITFTPSTGNLVVSGTVTANSDEKLKTNIKTIENALDKVLSLRGVEFDRVDTGDHQIGVIAQEVEQIIPDVVYPKQPSPDYEIKSVAYSNIVALLIEAIKEQNQKIADLERRLEGR